MKKLNLIRLMLCTGIASLLSLQTPLLATWEPPVVISNPAIPMADDSAPVLIVNQPGNALAVWTDSTSVIYPDEPAITTAFYLQGAGWLPPVVISSFAANCNGEPLFLGQGNPDIAMNSSNFALAVWQGENNECDDVVGDAASDGVILAVSRNTGGSFSATQIISNQSFVADNANVSVNELGQGLAAWRNFDGMAGHFYSAAFFVGSWQPQTNFATFPLLDGEGKPYPFINNNGEAVITWQGRIDATTFNIQAVNNINSIWGVPVTLDTGDSDISQDPRNALANNGNAVAIWQNGGSIKASFFDGTTWGAPVTLGDAAPLADNDGPEVVVDTNGNFTATWTALDNSIRSASTSNGVWSSSQTISTPGNIYSFDPFRSQETLAVNTKGDVIAIYHSVGAIYSAFKSFGLPWRPQELVASPSDGFIDNTLNIGLADCGFAAAIWQNAPNTLVYASINGNLIVPIDPTIVQCCKKDTSGRRCVNILTWEPDDCVLFYNIFCNGNLIAIVINNGEPLEFIDSLAFCRDCVYTISAVSILGFEGEPTAFVIN